MVKKSNFITKQHINVTAKISRKVTLMCFIALILYILIQYHVLYK